eukprot:COSAG03_NODE_742_length_6022_cov_8.352355_2_plen_305_part_00
MNHEQFSNALFELVDVWCEGAPSMLMYIEFLRMVFLNVTLLGRKKGHLEPQHKMKKVQDVSCLATSLDLMRSSTTERFNLEEQRAEKDREALARRANIGMVSSAMYVESSGGKHWVNSKSLVKSALRAGIFKEHQLHSEDHSDSSDASSSSSESGDDTDHSGDDTNGLSDFGSVESERSFLPIGKTDPFGSANAGRGSAQPMSSEAPRFECGADGSAVIKTAEQLEFQMEKMQGRLARGVFTSSEELESAILELQMMAGSGAVREAGLGEEHMALLEELEEQFAMKCLLSNTTTALRLMSYSNG